MKLHVSSNNILLKNSKVELPLSVSSPIYIGPNEKDIYDGEYEITPTVEEQILLTDNKVLKNDIIINPFPYNQLGLNFEKVQDLMNQTYLLKNTDYKTWDPSTTAKVIVASQNLLVYPGQTKVYDYYLHWRTHANIVYKDGTTLKAAVTEEIADLWQVLIKRPSSLANLSAGIYNANSCLTFFTAPLMLYYNTSGTATFTWSSTYGFYPAAVAATFSSSTTDTPNITIKTPTLNARCNSSYFAVARGSDVDQENSKIVLTGELLRVDGGTSAPFKFFQNIVNEYNE